MEVLGITVLIYVLLIIAFAKMFGEIATRFNQPSIVGELLAGIILGPFVLGAVFSELHSMYTDTFIQGLADLGILLLMLYVGMEFSMKQVAASSKIGAVIAISGMTIPMLLGATIGIFFYSSLNTIIFLAIAISVTALPVTIRILKDMEVLKTDTSVKIISASIITDVSMLFALGMLLGTDTTASLEAVLLQTGKYVVFFVSAILVSKYLVPQFYKILRWMRTGEAAFALAIGIAIAFAAAASIVQLPSFIGAFIAGMILHGAGKELKVWERVQNILSGVTLGFLAPVFFVLIGFSVNFSAVFLSGPSIIILFIVVSIAAIAGKIFGAYLPARLFGTGKYESMAIASMMMSKGAMELVFANLALRLNIIDEGLFSILILMAFISTALAPIFFKHYYNKAACAGQICLAKEEMENGEIESD